VLDGAPQVAFQPETILRPGMHVGVEHFVTRLAVRFRVIHRDVGVAHDLVGSLYSARPKAMPDADRRKHFTAADSRTAR
jgi:hypothetical protein